jgi:hypothetical protein
MSRVSGDESRHHLPERPRSIRDFRQRLIVVLASFAVLWGVLALLVGVSYLSKLASSQKSYDDTTLLPALIAFMLAAVSVSLLTRLLSGSVQGRGLAIVAKSNRMVDARRTDVRRRKAPRGSTVGLGSDRTSKRVSATARPRARTTASPISKDRTPMVLAAFSAVALTIVLGFGVVQGLRLESRAQAATIELQREAQAAQRYNEAVQQLASPNEVVRLGGVYAIDALLDGQYLRHTQEAEDLLAGFVRSRSQIPASGKGPSSPPLDVQAAISVLGQPWRAPLDLSTTWLVGAEMNDLRFARSDFSSSRLDGAFLWQSDLRESDLRQANLTGADLTGADLTRADLTGADLANAQLNGANLNGANLGGTNLNGASLDGSDLRNAVGLSTVALSCAASRKDVQVSPGLVLPSSRSPSCP